MLLVIISICFIIAGAVVVLTYSTFFNSTPRSVSTIYINANTEVSIDINLKQAYVSGFHGSSNPIQLNEESLSEYQEYFLDFYELANSNYSEYISNRHNETRKYWELRITDENDKDFYVWGHLAFPKGWSEFVSKTNELLGGEYLSDDTEGLPLK